MNRDRFREAKRIYGSALEREPAEREAYLREACAGDDTLRKDVESLLGHRTEAQEFFKEELFKAPPVQAGARGSAAEPHVDLTGRTMSHYAIVAKIGEGGMGVVYRARDTRLDRLVALKVLAPEKVADPERRRRFIQEARAASALNHPNIVTIHDIDTADGVTFIVMEYVKGKTLDQLIRGRRAPLNDVLKQGVQIADALSAAHVAGIVHRDIKPANIMLTDTGLVKVLDFGLAKLNQPPDRPKAELLTGSRPGTEDGVILGTVAYMSPEQAEGKNADPRSDIYSLGAVLYEMTTGRRAFAGATNASPLAAIRREDPKPASQLPVETPRELERVISRCLQKDRERRFQHMADLKVALEELKEESDSRALAAAALRGTRARRGRVWGVGGFLLAVALGIGAWLEVFRRPAAGPVATVSAFTVVPGVQTEPAVSPDGKQVAFVWNGDIHVQLVGDTTPRQVTSSPAFENSPVWSPDALQIAFLRGTASGTEVIVVPSAGGLEKRLLVSMASCGEVLARQFCGPAWSPDGRFLTVVDKESPEAPSSIFLVDIETRERRKLTTPPPGFEDGLSVFSPDGRSLAFARRPGWPLSDIYVLPLTDSGQRPADPLRITRDNAFIWGFDWTGDGRSIVFASSRGGVDSLWRVARSGGAPEGLTVGGNDAFWPSISRKGDRLAYSYGNASMHVWRVAAPGAERADEATTSPMRISHTPRWDQQPAFSPDGQRIAWSSTHSGSHQVWVSSSGGALPMQLTSLAPPGADWPRWSPDGRHIAFRGFNPGPRPDVYVIPAEGGAARRLTTGAFGVSMPSWSRDGRWVYFGSDRGEGVAIWKVPPGGGSPLLVARPGWWPVESLDGTAVYHDGLGEGIWKSPADGGGAPVLLARDGSPPIFESFDGTFVYYSGPDAGIWRVPAAGGEGARVLTAGKRAVWTASQTGIYVLDPDATGGPAIEFVPFAGKRRDLVRLPGEPGSYVEPLSGAAAGLAASPDGRWVVYLRAGPEQTKIMLVENFR